jgi:glutaconate CoA-transferase subunit A
MTKLMSLQQAVASYVHDGDIVFCSGFTHLIPFAAGQEIIRQGKKDLILARATPDLLYDMMVAAGCARKLIFSWAGNPGVGMLRAVRRAIEAGQLEVEEYSHFAMITRLAAGASGLPFLPMQPVGTKDLARANPNYRTVQCPYTGQELTTVPALHPDVAIIHAQRADAEGNTQIWGVIGEQKEAAFAAKRVIVTVEEVVDPEIIRSDPNRTVLPSFIVSAVCPEPYAAHPSYSQGYYDRDNPFYLEWDQISATPDRLTAWLDEWVYQLPGRAEYWRKLGEETHRRLAVTPLFSQPVNYGAYGAG